MDHRHPVRVYYADTDAGGVVYHAAYLHFAEAARTEALRAAGLPHARMIAEHGVMFMVRHVELAYLRPARLDDIVSVHTRVTGCRPASVDLVQEMSVEGTMVCTVRVELVCASIQTGRPARLPEAWRALLAPVGFAPRTPHQRPSRDIVHRTMP